MVFRNTVGLQDFTPEQRIQADVTDNGEVSNLDVNSIHAFAVGLIHKFEADAVWE
jgi:hypothetical protein